MREQEEFQRQPFARTRRKRMGKTTHLPTSRKTNAGEEAETSSTTSITTIEKTKEMGSDIECELVGLKPERLKSRRAAGEFAHRGDAGVDEINQWRSDAWVESVAGNRSGAERGVLLGSFGGRYLKETSDTESFKRPEKPLKLTNLRMSILRKGARLSLASIWTYSISAVTAEKISRVCQGNWRKAQFPYLIDENTGTKMYESDDIIEYLYENMGRGNDKVPV